jgi:homoserine kinase
MPSNYLCINTSSSATIANLGAGFDCLAMAVDLRNEYNLYSYMGEQVTGESNIPEFTLYDPFDGPYGKTDRRMRTLNQNLFVESFRYTRKLLCGSARRPIPNNPCLVFQRVNIPPVRGLGSSSSACVAGVLAGIEFVHAKYPEVDMQELLGSLAKGPVGDHQIREIQATLANRSDSNPDNVCAALVGGMTYCYSDEDPADYHLNTSGQRLHFFRDAMEDETLRCLALVPTKELSTPQARQILAAERYTIEDVVFNLQRTASIPRIFHERRYELLREVTKDKIHQDQRARSLYTNDRGKAINIWYVFQAVMDSGAYCAFISGAGSTLVALAHSSKAEEVALAFRDAFTEVAPDDWKIERIMTLRPTNQGAAAIRTYTSETSQLDNWVRSLTEARESGGMPLKASSRERDRATRRDDSEQPAAASVFISYSRHDGEMCRKLCDHLGGLRDGGFIKDWTDGQIIPGQEWESEIIRQMDNADIILLLVTSSFLGSEFIKRVELVRALERHRRGEAIVIPVILRPTDWESGGLKKLQALPTDGKPVSTWSDSETGYVEIARGLRRVVESWRSRER